MFKCCLSDRVAGFRNHAGRLRMGAQVQVFQEQGVPAPGPLSPSVEE